MADNPLNAVNRGVYIADNLDFLKALSDGCIDLVCIDPPFAKNETFGNGKSRKPGFRNEIAWQRMSGTQSTANRFFTQHGNLLYYNKSGNFTWNRELEKLTDDEKEDDQRCLSCPSGTY